MDKELLNRKDTPWLKDSVVLLTDTGSKAYGTNLETSDEDYKGICVPPIEYAFGLQTFEQIILNDDSTRRNTSEDVDVTIYGLNKFVRLAVSGNPNVLELLFTDEENIHIKTDVGSKLIENRGLFLTNKITGSFGGFALQQKNKFEKGLGQRKELVEKYGYDTKTVMHGVRLYEMAIEAFLTGTFTTKRPNAEELKDIRRGKYTKQGLMEMMNDYERHFQEARAKSVLPDKPNMKKVDKMLVGLTMDYYGL